MPTPSLPPLADSQTLWKYLADLQPGFMSLLAHFGCEDALILVSRDEMLNTEIHPSSTSYGHTWVVNDGLHMDGDPEEFMRAAENLTELVANFSTNTSEIESPNPMPAGFGTISKPNADGWIVVVTGPDTNAVCRMIAEMVISAIVCYEALIATD